ncbi:protein kinase domain-containing protein [Neobacillus niacini]|uniref:serine/threonine protein kinase n=1 Tax=Neobacillus niacini TaxID=86668 RepID=UPI00285A2AAF|nr:protein kinase [Neobacillus niacini]MDR6998208.1 serine/threonine-protein kinase [Neobacillus niacini]
MWKRMIHTVSGIIEKPFPKNELIANRYKVIEQIGAGSYGFCYLVLDQENHQIKVLKTLRLHKRMTEAGKHSFEFEKKLLASLKHQGFPRYFEDGIYKEIPFYTMEYMDGKNFEQLIFIEGKIFPEKEAFLIAGQLLHLIGLLHDQQIIHRDIRIPNVIVADSTIRLIDFGLARKLRPLNATERKWKRDLRKEINPQADFYGLGHFLLFLLYSDFPVPKDKKEKSWEEELSISSGAKHIIRRLLQIEPAYENCKQIETDILEII